MVLSDGGDHGVRFQWVYEALEAVVAVVVSPEFRGGLSGHQGTSDAQKDNTALAGCGAVAAMVVNGRWRARCKCAGDVEPHQSRAIKAAHSPDISSCRPLCRCWAPVSENHRGPVPGWFWFTRTQGRFSALQEPREGCRGTQSASVCDPGILVRRDAPSWDRKTYKNQIERRRGPVPKTNNPASYDQTVDIVHSAIPRMSELKIPITPSNYAVWYEVPGVTQRGTAPGDGRAARSRCPITETEMRATV